MVYEHQQKKTRNQAGRPSESWAFGPSGERGSSGDDRRGRIPSNPHTKNLEPPGSSEKPGEVRRNETTGSAMLSEQLVLFLYIIITLLLVECLFRNLQDKVFERLFFLELRPPRTIRGDIPQTRFGGWVNSQEKARAIQQTYSEKDARAVTDAGR